MLSTTLIIIDSFEFFPHGKRTSVRYFIRIVLIEISYRRVCCEISPRLIHCLAQSIGIKPKHVELISRTNDESMNLPHLILILYFSLKNFCACIFHTSSLLRFYRNLWVFVILPEHFNNLEQNSIFKIIIVFQKFRWIEVCWNTSNTNEHIRQRWNEALRIEKSFNFLWVVHRMKRNH